MIGHRFDIPLNDNQFRTVFTMNTLILILNLLLASSAAVGDSLFLTKESFEALKNNYINSIGHIFIPQEFKVKPTGKPKNDVQTLTLQQKIDNFNPSDQRTFAWVC